MCLITNVLSQTRLSDQQIAKIYKSRWGVELFFRTFLVHEPGGDLFVLVRTDTRIRGTTRQHVGRVFREVERPALQPLPPERFPCFQESPRTVYRDGYVEVAKACYSAPAGLGAWASPARPVRHTASRGAPNRYDGQMLARPPKLVYHEP